MTSVPNRRQRLSGNSWFISIIAAFLISGCAPSTSSSARTEVLKPDVKKEKEAQPKLTVDTIEWTFTPEEEFPPISVTTRVAAYRIDKVTKELYDIVLMLPMRIQDDNPTINTNNKKFADFYAGMKLAAVREKDLKANMRVFYTDRDKNKMRSILAELERNPPDLIIAPYESELIALAAEFGRENRIPVISPWKSSTSITSDNVFYLQMRPSIEHYYRRIIDHVSYSFQPENVRIIQRSDGQDEIKTRLLQKIQETSSGVPIVSPFEVLNISLDSLMDAESAVFDTALVDGVEAFILPHFSSRDESFIYSCLRKMYGEKAGREFYVYAMPVTLNSERIDINILKNLSIRIPEFRFPDQQDKEVQDFKKHFYQSFGWLPTEDAYYGYDLMDFIIYGLKNHGQYFHYFMAGENLRLMQMNVQIEPFYKEDNQERPDFMANNHLYIIEFDRDHFKVRDIR